MSYRNYEFITDPGSNQTFHITSPEGMNLIKNFVVQIDNQRGGFVNFNKIEYQKITLFFDDSTSKLYENMPLSTSMFDSLLEKFKLQRIPSKKVAKAIDHIGIINMEALQQWWCSAFRKDPLIFKYKRLEKLKTNNGKFGMVVLNTVDDKRMVVNTLHFVKSPFELKTVSGNTSPEPNNFLKKFGKKLGIIKLEKNSRVDIDEDKLKTILKKAKLPILGVKNRKSVEKSIRRALARIYKSINGSHLVDNGLDPFGYHYYVFSTAAVKTNNSSSTTVSFKDQTETGDVWNTISE